jgi:hypothetical protein
MSVGGLSNVRPNGNPSPGNHGAGANSESQGKEFSLEKQKAGAVAGASVSSNPKVRKKTTEIVDKTKRNRKGAPRTIIVDGDIYEVFLLAIA